MARLIVVLAVMLQLHTATASSNDTTTIAENATTTTVTADTTTASATTNPTNATTTTVAISTTMVVSTTAGEDWDATYRVCTTYFSWAEPNNCYNGPEFCLWNTMDEPTYNAICNELRNNTSCSERPEAQKVTGLLCARGFAARGGGSTTTTTADTTTASTTTTTNATTTAKVEMKIAEPKKFKEEDFVQEMAKKTGVPVENVKVKSMEMKLSVGYSLKGKAKVTQDQAESAIAQSLEIKQSQVSVEILANGRRLEDRLRGRRLDVVETKMKATITMDANDEKQIEKAQEAHEKLADSGKSAAMLENVQKVLREEGIEIELPEVTEKPQVEVKVETEIVAVSKTPVVLPTGEDLKEVAEKAGADDIEVTEVKTGSPPFDETSTTTTTDAPQVGKISAGSMSLPPFMILTLALAAPLLV